MRANLAQGVHYFIITDDNLARNKNWEAIFDRLIHLREVEGFRFKFIIQVDGGVKTENIRKLRKAGADCFVAGSAVFGHSDRARAVEDLRSALGGK